MDSTLDASAAIYFAVILVFLVLFGVGWLIDRARSKRVTSLPGSPSPEDTVSAKRAGCEHGHGIEKVRRT